MKKGISVILCCYNSAERLPETLAHLACQKIAKTIPVEIIIVNNASTDTTKETAQLEWNRNGSPFPFRIVDENRPGVIFARQTGIKNASYEYVLWVDDDNWLNDNYLQLAFDRMESNPAIGVLGGQSVGVSTVSLPDWFGNGYCYAVGKQAQQTGFVAGCIWGAASVMRTQIVLKVFSSDCPFLLIGRQGNLVLSGDDAEICRRTLLLNYRLFYDESLCFSHFMPPFRLQESYHKRLLEGFAHANSILAKYDTVEFAVHLSRLMQLKSIVALFIKILFRCKKVRSTSPVATLRAKVCLLLNTTRWSNDSEYTNILNFYFTHRQ
jgi:glycosyltransferase involved in cell wall biosynthesis